MEADPILNTHAHAGSARGALPTFIVICLVALALRLWVGWWLGFLSDINCFQIWALDPGEFILPTPNYKIPVKNYPPIYLSILKLLRWGHRAFDLPGDFRTTIQFAELIPPRRPIILLLKTPSMVADIISGAIIFAMGRHLRRVWTGVAVAAFYLFSPAILYDGAYYGQTDTILLTFLFAALYAWMTRRAFWFGAMLVAAPLMKMQAFFVLIIFGVAILAEWKTVWGPRWRRLFAGGAVSLACVVALAAVTGQLAAFRDGLVNTVGWFPLVTSHAFNLWWLLMRPWDKPPFEPDFPLDTERVLGLVSYRTIGLILFFTALSLILWRLHRRAYTPYALVLACVAAGWAFFNLPTEIHERYSITAIGFMCLLPFWNRRWYPFALLASLATMLNIVTLAYFHFPPSRAFTNLVNWIIWPEQHHVWSILAIIHILMLPLTLDALWRGDPGTRPSTPAFPVVVSSGQSQADILEQRRG